MRLPLLPGHVAWLVFFALGLAGCKRTTVTERRVESRMADAEGVTLLEVRNLRGDIEVVAYRHLKKTLEVTATFAVTARRQAQARELLKQCQLRIHRDGAKATVLVSHPPEGSAASHSTRLRLIVPADTDLDADTGSGGIRVLGITGTVTARTGQGDIEVLGARRAAHLEAKQGQVKLSGELPSFEVRSGRGDVSVLVHKRTSLDEPSAIVASAGRVTLSLSDPFHGQLSLTAKEVVFVTPFPALKKQGSTWAGTLGSGGKLLSVSAPKGELRMVARPYFELRSSPQVSDGPRRRPGGGAPMMPPPLPGHPHPEGADGPGGHQGPERHHPDGPQGPERHHPDGPQGPAGPPSHADTPRP